MPQQLIKVSGLYSPLLKADVSKTPRKKCPQAKETPISSEKGNTKKLIRNRNDDLTLKSFSGWVSHD